MSGSCEGAGNDTLLAILFADIADSTGLYNALGIKRARAVVLQCLDIVETVVRSSGGTPRDRIGDELMCSFGKLDDAATAAIRIQMAVKAGRSTGTLLSRLGLRIGMQFGPILEKDNALFGDTIHTAKRVVDLAKADQILTTGETLLRLDGSIQVFCRRIDRLILKGQSRPVEIHEILWDQEEATLQYSRAARPAGERVELRADHAGRQYCVTDDAPVLTIGRDPGCDIVLSQQGVSRFHARIILSKGIFRLRDQSTNGTILLSAIGSKRPVHRDEVHLPPEGTISIGSSERMPGERLIRFRIHSANPPVEPES